MRGEIFAKIRRFFARRRVVEVTTPLLLPTTNPTPYLNNFSCDGLYLQSSPEFAMKKLLATGSGDIYQICKAFRKDEVGRLHNPEFTILEWYRVGFDHHDLMSEVEELLRYTIKSPQAKRRSYQEVCEEFLKINPHKTNIQQLKQVAQKNNLAVSKIDNNPDTWLQLLFTHIVEPKLKTKHPVFVYDFPETQAMLARTRQQGKAQVASRFEVYYQGIELANGFHELNDAKEQRRRFNHELTQRKKLNLPSIPIDEEFLDLLPKLPNCSGVALGIDRLLLLAAKAQSLAEIN